MVLIIWSEHKNWSGVGVSQERRHQIAEEIKDVETEFCSEDDQTQDELKN